MNPRESLSEVFERLRREKRKAFIPYIVAGDPAFSATRLFLTALQEAGADVVELGVPFSDPNADGPINQRASERALRSGVTLRKILSFVARYRRQGPGLPIVLFTYFNPLLRFGLPAFSRAAKKAGVDGVLVVDLPPEEAASYRRHMKAQGLDTVFLAAPTTTPERLRLIAGCATGFVYYVSRLGVTGVGRTLSPLLTAQLRRAKAAIKQPLVVGFGISTHEQARAAAQGADGVVVGSALVQLAQKHRPTIAARRMKSLASGMVRAMKSSGRGGQHVGHDGRGAHQAAA